MASITSRPSSLAPSFDAQHVQRLADLRAHYEQDDLRERPEARRSTQRTPLSTVVTSDNLDIGSLFVLNRGAEGIFSEERWCVGDIDPATVDLEPEALTAYRAANAKPLPPLKTEIQTHRDVVAVRSKRR